MLRTFFFSWTLFACLTVAGQDIKKLDSNKSLQDITLKKGDRLKFSLPLEKNGIYQFSIEQKGIAISYELVNSKNEFQFKSKTPYDIVGFLKNEFSPINSDNFTLTIQRYDDPENTDEGKVTIFVKRLSKLEITKREKIKKELASENAKTVQTIDIDHFWEAFDNLKTCKTFADSTKSFQTLYLDRATDGLIDFIEARDFTAERFVQTVSRYPKFYASIRKSSYEVKKSEPLIEEVFANFKSLYANFRPFKVCFAIGIVNTGGTISDNFVLIGTEITTSTKEADLSEFIKYEEMNIAQMLSNSENIVQKIKNIVAHECVHTQQKPSMDTTGIYCELLYKVIREGSCDFIGELVAGSQINKTTHDYGNKNEKQLWIDLKAELCNTNIGNWLYNGLTIKNKPADLGYYIGYKIAEEYYKNAADKRQAIIDIIETTNPIKFLQLSGYDKKPKQ